MPHSIESARAQPGSNSPAECPPKAVPLSPQFTEPQQSSPPQGSPRPESSSDSASSLSPDELSLDATERFPPGLFRVPVPDTVFAKMPEISDSALRCLLGLINLSFRFDPAEDKWVHPGDWFSRRDVEEESGLSDQATRNGLDELESLGWLHIDRDGRSHQHRLLLGVPDCQFTYVPTALLDQASDVGSGTELRVVLAVLRRTWGWTTQTTDAQSRQQKTVHDRWTQLSNGELAGATGRSETAVGQAARNLQGEWIERVRPGNGAFQYRFLPERIVDRSEEESSVSGNTANDLAPDRQKSGTPTSNRESSSRDKQRSRKKSTSDTSGEEASSSEPDAVPTENFSEKTAASKETSQTSSPNGETPPPNFSNLSPEKRDLAEKLSNVGLWAGRIAEVLSRFSTERIRANFELYRRRSAEETIRSPGAWLYAAITDGYALPDSNSEASDGNNPEGATSLPPLEHKETVTKAKKDAYVAEGVAKDRFHRCPSPRDRPTEICFMYFDPSIGGPERRTRPEQSIK